MQIWPRNTQDRKVEHESHDRCDWYDDLPWGYIVGRVIFEDDIVTMDHVIT